MEDQDRTRIHACFWARKYNLRISLISIFRGSYHTNIIGPLKRRIGIFHIEWIVISHSCWHFSFHTALLEEFSSCFTRIISIFLSWLLSSDISCNLFSLLE